MSWRRKVFTQQRFFIGAISIDSRNGPNLQKQVNKGGNFRKKLWCSVGARVSLNQSFLVSVPGLS